MRFLHAVYGLLLLLLALPVACSDQKRQQSPVDIAGYLPNGVPMMVFGHNAIGSDYIRNTGDFIKVKYENAGSILVDARHQCLLTEIHVHNPSEHTVEGEQFALETHLVYKGDSGEIAVVAVLYRLGEANAAIQEIIDSAPRQGENDTKPSSPLMMATFLPDGHGYYAYMGSLTTPPFTEGVHWFVMSDVLEVSAEQVREIAALTGGGANNRELQPLNDRKIRAFQVD